MSKSIWLDPCWQKYRLKRLEAANWQCEICGDSKTTLHIHHFYYVAGRKPWEYLPQCTACLCAECHEALPVDFHFTEGEEWEFAAGAAIQNWLGMVRENAKATLCPNYE